MFTCCQIDAVNLIGDPFSPKIYRQSPVKSERDSLTVSTLACHAAGPGSNLGEDDFSYLVLFSATGP